MGKSWIAPVIIGIVGAAILVSLGNWQVNRLAWKERVLAEIDARMSDVPTDVPARPEKAVHLYQPVQMSGQSGARELHVLVSHKRLGPGYRIIQSFATDDRTILVDRGFLKLDRELTAPPAGKVTVTGNLHWPDDLNSSTPDPDIEGGLWFARDLGPMAKVLDTLNCRHGEFQLTGSSKQLTIELSRGGEVIAVISSEEFESFRQFLLAGDAKFTGAAEAERKRRQRSLSAEQEHTAAVVPTAVVPRKAP